MRAESWMQFGPLMFWMLVNDGDGNGDDLILSEEGRCWR